MHPTSLVCAACSVMCIGAFWPTLKVNYDAVFVRRFIVPIFVLAVANCFVLATALSWWVALAFPALALVGSLAIRPFTSGKHLQTLLLGGGIWLIGIAAALLAVIGLVLHWL